MTSKFSNIFSVVFHPFLITLYCFLVLFGSGSYVTFLPGTIKLVMLIVVLFNTFLIPIISLFILKKLGLIKNFYLEKHRERIIPIAITSIPYIFTLYLMAKLPVPPILVRIVASGILVLIIAAVVSYWWKISLHLLGIGGLSGFLFACMYSNFFSALPLLMVVFLISGFLAAARMFNGDHTPTQVYAGYLAGFTTVLLFFLI